MALLMPLKRNGSDLNEDTMNEINSETKQKIISIIKALMPTAKIYLFGSRARGTARKWSDIDIALDVGHAVPLTAIDELISMFQATNIPYKIEIVDFHQVNPDMQNAIKNEGVLWKP